MSALACPTPDKQIFDSKRQACQGKLANHAHRPGRGKRLTAYLCPCGLWHLRTWRQPS